MRSFLVSVAAVRFVLAWFLATLLAAALAPAVQPTSLALVCSDAGLVTMVVVDHDGLALPAGSHTLDCALCLPVSPPPAVATGAAGQINPAGPLQAWPAVVHMPRITGAALPPRGPPATLVPSFA